MFILDSHISLCFSLVVTISCTSYSWALICGSQGLICELSPVNRLYAIPGFSRVFNFKTNVCKTHDLLITASSNLNALQHFPH